MIIRDMLIADYEEVYDMWQITTARAMTEKDQKEDIKRYLERNKGLSKVAVKDQKIVGAVLIGHDSRIGFVHHLAVLPEYRRHSVASKMMGKAIEDLNREKVEKIYLFSYTDNTQGQDFWESMGFKKREDMFIYTK